MIVKLVENTYLNALRDGDIVQGIDEAGTILIMGKYQESFLTSYNLAPIKNLINVVVDKSLISETVIIRGIKYKKLYGTTWTFEKEGV